MTPHAVVVVVEPRCCPNMKMPTKLSKLICN